MREIVQGKLISPRMLVACFALSMLFTPNAHGQRKQAFTQSESSTPTQCRNDQLSLEPEFEAAMGELRHMRFFLTNTSSAPCALIGFPRFEMFNKSRRATRSIRAVNVQREPPQLVTIEPGKTATFLISYTARREDEPTGKPCPTYRRFRVTVPGMTRVFVQSYGYRHRIEVCASLGVWPIIGPGN